MDLSSNAIRRFTFSGDITLSISGTLDFPADPTRVKIMAYCSSGIMAVGFDPDDLASVTGNDAMVIRKFNSGDGWQTIDCGGCAFRLFNFNASNSTFGYYEFFK